MSTLEKTIDLLQNMPEQSIQSVYDFVQTLLMRQISKRPVPWPEGRLLCKILFRQDG